MEVELKKAVFYVRVSTDLQDYERQIKDLSIAARLQGYEHPQQGKNLFEDKISGYKKRENFQLMQNYILENNVKACFVWEISRIARKYVYLVNAIDWFECNKVNLYIHNPSFWLLDDNGNKSLAVTFSISLLGSYAEYEGKQMKERFESSRKARTQAGKNALGNILYGYKKGPDKIVIPDDDIIEELGISNADIIKEIFHLYLKNHSYKKVAAICTGRNYPAMTHEFANIGRILKHRSYIGGIETKYGYRPYPPIVEQELFDKVQRALEQNKKNKGHYTKSVSILKDIIVCPHCGSSYGIHVSAGYFCISNYKLIIGGISNIKQCPSDTFSEGALNGIIWEYCKPYIYLFRSEEINEQYQSSINTEIEKLNQNKQELNNVIQARKGSKIKINKMFVLEGISDTEYGKQIKAINNEINQLNNEVSNIEAEIFAKEKLLTIRSEISDVIDEIENLTDLHTIKKLINITIKEIKIYTPTITDRLLKITHHDGNITYILYYRHARNFLVYSLKQEDVIFDEKNVVLKWREQDHPISYSYIKEFKQMFETTPSSCPFQELHYQHLNDRRREFVRKRSLKKSDKM